MSNGKLTEKDKRFLLQLARSTVENHLSGVEAPVEIPESQALLANSGAFVTLHMNENLRGCIGSPLPVKPLYLAVRENAIAAAFHDPRFPPLSKSELPDVDFEISVMTLPTAVAGPEEVEVGRDGIIISLGGNRGLLLPQVAVEQRWDRDQFLRYGCMKAGLDPECLNAGATIETFQAVVFGEKSLMDGTPG